MSKRILLITGWGVGTAPLIPLQDALQHLGHKVTLIDIFTPENESEWQQVYTDAQAVDVLMGWSLGGQLALLLAKKIYENTGIAKPVIALASNPNFVADDDWQHAMPILDFERFEQQFLQDDAQTLKQFYLNICRGQPKVKQNWLWLLQHANPPQNSVLVDGLKQLKNLKLTDILPNYPSQIQFVLAEHDAVVPCKVAKDIADIASKNLSMTMLDGLGHSFAVFNIEETLQVIGKILSVQNFDQSGNGFGR